MIRKYICPKCKEKAGVKIVYGMPSFEVAEQARRGEVEIGGCLIIDDQPNRHCTACGAEWLIKRNVDKRNKAMNN